jgi:hypothetical protein
LHDGLAAIFVTCSESQRVRFMDDGSHQTVNYFDFLEGSKLKYDDAHAAAYSYNWQRIGAEVRLGHRKRAVSVKEDQQA